MTPKQRLSFGGEAVARSLVEVGFDIENKDVALVETALPPRAYTSVLLQSAWNVVPLSEFRRLLAPYPWRMKVRAVTRRRLAMRNMRTAGQIVALTASVARQLNESAGLSAAVCPATIPLAHLPTQHVPRVSLDTSFAVVPGTMTWYKRPSDSIVWCRDEGIGRILFAGADDGSGCWQHVAKLAEREGIEVHRRILSEDQLRQEMHRASAVILPSELESLGFALSEALVHATRVIARPIEAHVEVASRTGRNPEWMDGAIRDLPERRELITPAQARAEWTHAGRVLGLRQRQPTSEIA